MKVNKINTNNGLEEFITISKDELCPICGKKPQGFRWNMFHGEVSSACCNIPLQIKDYYIDNDETEEYKDFVKSIGSDETGYVVNVDKKWIEPLKQAIDEIGICDIKSKRVLNRSQQLLERSQYE